jgi:hypothetical protein
MGVTRRQLLAYKVVRRISRPAAALNDKYSMIEFYDRKSATDLRMALDGEE